MKPHPRIRKTVKWGGAAVTVLLVVAWIAGGWWSFGWARKNDFLCLAARGRLIFAFAPGLLSPTDPAGWGAVRIREHFDWWFGWESDADGWALFVPLWFPTSLTLLAAAAAWRLDTLARRRAMPNLCPKCHYDRTGLAPGAVCPECGSASG